MEAVTRIIDEAERKCKANGSRLTNKRKHVLSLLLKSGKALSAYELVEAYKSELGETLPAMSIYRILEFLEGEYLAHKLSLANKYVACEHICCQHDHDVSQFLICNQCQKVKEISIGKPTMSGLKKNIQDAGFHLVSPQLEMNCVCNICATGPL